MIPYCVRPYRSGYRLPTNVIEHGVTFFRGHEFRPRSGKMTTMDRERCCHSQTTAEEANATGDRAGSAASVASSKPRATTSACCKSIAHPCRRGHTGRASQNESNPSPESVATDDRDKSVRRPQMLHHQHPSIISTPLIGPQQSIASPCIYLVGAAQQRSIKLA